MTRSSTRRSGDPARHLTHGTLGGGLQPVQRGAQIVGGAVEHGAHAERELLDTVEHGVDFAGQRVDLVVRVAHGQTLRQIAAHDLRRHRGDGARLSQDAPAHPEAAAETEQQRQRHGGDEAAHHQVLDVLALLHIVPDEHVVAAGQLEAARAHLVVAHLLAERHRRLELDPLAVIGVRLGPRGNISRDRPQLRIHHEIHGAAHVLVLGALLHEFDEIAARQNENLLAQSLHLGVDQIVAAAIDDARHCEVDDAEQQSRAAGEDDRVDDGDAKRRSIEDAEEALIGTCDPSRLRVHYSSSRRL